MLQASGLVKSFGGFQALAGCSLEIARQSITGIIGPNGAGKSTLFNVLGGLMLPEAGDVTFDGRSILRLRPDERARIGVVRTFQISRELGELTVLENMLLASPHQYGEDLWRCFLMPARVRDQERAAVAQARGETILKLRKQGLTFAIIEHDMDVIAQLCAPIFVLAEGRTLMRGTYREVASNGAVMNAYLGKAA